MSEPLKSNHPNLVRLSASRELRQKTITHNLVAILAILADCLAIATAIILSWQVYSGFFLNTSFDLWFFTRHFLIVSVLFIGLTALKWGYRFPSIIHKDRTFKDVFSLWSLTSIVFIMMLFVMKVSEEFSRGSILISYPLGLALLIMTRKALRNRLLLLVKDEVIAPDRVLILGHAREVKLHQKLLKNEPSLLLETAILPLQNQTESDEDYLIRLKGELTPFVNLARDKALSRVLIVCPWKESALIQVILDEFMVLPLALHLTSEEFLNQMRAPIIQSIGGVSTLALVRQPLSSLEITMKRAFDLIAGVAILGLIAPFMLLIAYLIKRESKGPALFKQWRNGFNQNPFMIYKFRSMRVMEEGAKVQAAKKDDSRVTKIGAFIRRWNLDELPQIINVIKGDMSLVGPRPHPLNLDEIEQTRVSLYARRFNIKPGMTGWAQVNGARGSVSDENSMARRIDFDLWYMDHWSLGLDISIMIKTITSKKAFENAF